MAVFEKGVDALSWFVVAQGAVLLITSAIAVPPQKNLGPTSDCLAGYPHCLMTSALRYYFLSIMAGAALFSLPATLVAFIFASIFASIGLVTGLKAGLISDGGLANMSPGRKTLARAFMIITVFFSALTSCLAISTHSMFLESTTVLRSCLSPAEQQLMVANYVVLAITAIAFPTIAFLRIVLFAAE